MTRSDQIEQLSAALALAQGQMEAAAKDSNNPHFHSSYADLASIWGAIRKALSDNGLSVIQPVAASGATVTVTTILAHSSGQWISCDLTLTAKAQKSGGGWEVMDNPQAIGSTITYARRYGLSAMVGAAPDEADDDGEGAEGRGKGAGGDAGKGGNNGRQSQSRSAKQSQPKPELINKEQRDKLFSLAHTGKQTPEQIKAIMAKHGFQSSAEITADKYDAIFKEIQGPQQTPATTTQAQTPATEAVKQPDAPAPTDTATPRPGDSKGSN